MALIPFPRWGLSDAEKAELQYWMAICEDGICELSPKEKARVMWLGRRDAMGGWFQFVKREEDKRP